MPRKPLIAITMGDPAGIGPEVVLKAIAAPEVLAACRPVVIAHHAALELAANQLGLAADWVTVPDLSTLDPDAPVQVCDLGGAPLEQLFGCRPTPQGGTASLAYIQAAALAAQAGHVDAIATAPIHKQAIAMAGCRFTGHTDFLADLCATPHVVMMLAGGPLRVALVTTHIRLSDVPDAISTEGIVATARITADSLHRFFGLSTPRLAICGLNPHASDGSRFGDEELRIIEPAIVQLRHAGTHATGPIPPDTCFVRAATGEFDAVVAMYHDQGLIPLKLLAFDNAVNITLALPIIRTSVDHGTAYDIAGKGVASPNSMIAAVTLAATMSKASGLAHP